MNPINIVAKKYQNAEAPDVRPGMRVRVIENTQEKGERGAAKAQSFSGIVIAVKHGRTVGATLTVRGYVGDQWVEKIYPLHSPVIRKVEVLKQGKARRAKLYFIRGLKDSELRKKLKI